MSKQPDKLQPQALNGVRWLLALLPLIVFLGLAAIFYKQLAAGGSSKDLPSMLIGQLAPAATLEPLIGLQIGGKQVPGLSGDLFAGKVTLLNVFASWCVPCRLEHLQLLQLAQDKRIQLIGLNYKDERENALGFLGQLGNPYSAVGVDQKGRVAIEWGVYGVPETYLIGPDGVIRFKHIGPILPETLARKIMPAVEKLLAEQG